jgi:PTH1 family peptidyl-tRNA hydrolase
VKLIVGLGNPGEGYKDTRHNIGWQAVDRLAVKAEIDLQKRRFNSIFGQGVVFGFKVIIAKPLTYMNLSGEAIGQIANYYKIPVNDIIVIHDDMDIIPGNIRLKKDGGSSGHRGIDSIITCLKDNNFLRIRIGIGKPPAHIDPADYVLQKFSDEEKKILKGVMLDIQKCIEIILKQGPETAMNRFHTANKTVQ